MAYKDAQRQKAAQHRSYERNKRANIARTSANRVERRRALATYVQELKRQPCTDCSHTYPYYVMEFDHVRGDKVESIANLVNAAVKLEVIQAEVEKCELVCANCHRARTYQRGFNNGNYGALV